MTEKESRYSEWRNLIEEQEKSGINQESFCKMKGVSVAKLQYYRKKTGFTPAQPRQKSFVFQRNPEPSIEQKKLNMPPRRLHAAEQISRQDRSSVPRSPNIHRET